MFLWVAVINFANIARDFLTFSVGVWVKLFLTAFLVLSGLLTMGVAAATPITWNVNSTFTSGDTVVGSFVYDADTNTYSAINVVYTQSGSANTLSTCSATCSNNRFVFTTSVAVGNPAIDFILAGGAALTNAGGTINSASGAYTGTCNAFGGNNCANVNTVNGNVNQAFILTGSAASAVPALSEWARLVLALMAIGVAWHFHNARRSSC